MRADQAEKLGTAIENVEQHFPVLQILTGKWAAIAALFWAAGRIYLPMAKDIAAGQLAARPPVNPQTQPVAMPQQPAAQEGAVIPVMTQVVDEQALAREWLTH